MLGLGSAVSAEVAAEMWLRLMRASINVSRAQPINLPVLAFGLTDWTKWFEHLWVAGVVVLAFGQNLSDQAGPSQCQSRRVR